MLLIGARWTFISVGNGLNTHNPVQIVIVQMDIFIGRKGFILLEKFKTCFKIWVCSVREQVSLHRRVMTTLPALAPVVCLVT